MRHILCALAVAAAAFAAGQAGAQAAPPVSKIAVSAERFGTQATYRSPAAEVAYSAQARRAAACLATYARAYDPRTDLVRLRPGVTRRCAV